MRLPTPQSRTRWCMSRVKEVENTSDEAPLVSGRGGYQEGAGCMKGSGGMIE